MEIFAQLEALRVLRGISKLALCNAAGVSRKAYYYSGTRMRLKTLLKLLAVLDGKLTVTEK